jgi:GDP-4-dehydro-6-deoxy-D-mannose reductase
VNGKNGTIKKVLVFGAKGFIGGNLCPLLEQKGLTVLRADEAEGAEFRLDALNREQVKDLIAAEEPDCIINLAGLTDESRPVETHRANTVPLINIAESLLELGSSCRVVVLGTAAEYGAAAVTTGGLAEDSPKAPISHYGISKLAQTHLAWMYHRLRGVDVRVARPFNILGPKMRPGMVPACFIRQFLDQAAGAKEIRVQTLDSVRDFLSVKDVASALYQVMAKGEPGASYNICSGGGTGIKDILMMVARELHAGDYHVVANVQPGNGVPWSVGDNSRLKKLGWRQEDSFSVALRAVIASMRKE